MHRSNQLTAQISKAMTLAVSLAMLTTACSSVSANSSSLNNSASSSTSTKLAKQPINTADMTSYQLDPHHSNVRFAINHMNTSTVTGGFYELTGTVKFSKKQQAGYGKIIIPMDSLHTVSKQFTNHLKNPDFFNTEKYPTAIFESSKWHFNGDKVSKIDGSLTMLGKSKPVTLTATSFNCYFSPVVKKTMCGGDFTTTIDRTQWGMSKYVMMGIPKELRLDIEIEAIKQ